MADKKVGNKLYFCGNCDIHSYISFCLGSGDMIKWELRDVLRGEDKIVTFKAKFTHEYLNVFPALKGKYSIHICESADGMII